MVSYHRLLLLLEENVGQSSTGLTASESRPDVSFASAGNAPGKSSYANVTSKLSGKKLNIRTLFTSRGNGIDVVVPVESIQAISERFTNTAYGFFLGKRVAYPVVANYVRNTWGKYELVFSTWMAFGGNTRDFGSFWRKNRQDYDSTLIPRRSYAYKVWRRCRVYQETASERLK
ncbi:hypothetical protein Tco_1127990 [Tanacetum coccineum]